MLYANYTKLQKKWQTFMTNNGFWTTTVEMQQQQNKKANIKVLARARNHPRRLEPHA